MIETEDSWVSTRNWLKWTATSSALFSGPPSMIRADSQPPSSSSCMAPTRGTPPTEQGAYLSAMDCARTNWTCLLRRTCTQFRKSSVQIVPEFLEPAHGGQM